MTENTEVRKEKQLAQDLSGSQTELGNKGCLCQITFLLLVPSALGGEAVKEKARMPAASTLEDNSVLHEPSGYLSFSLTCHKSHSVLLKQVYFHYE